MNNFKEKDIVALLVRRGFLVEKVDSKYVISDNAHEMDALYLDEILKKYNIGRMQGNEIKILNIDNGINLQEMFKDTEPIIMDNSWKTEYRWSYFAYYHHGKKVPVEIMEANVAFYCKALSACGISTISCCDGNHLANTQHNLFVRLLTPADAFWNYLIWQKVLSKKFNLDWDESFQTIVLTMDNKVEVYESIYHVATYLYNNRIYFRKLKKDTTSIITKKFIRTHSDDEIKEVLTNRLLKLLECKENAIP